MDSDGKPLVAFHGTTKEFNEFRVRQGSIGNPKRNWMGDLGAWFATPAKSGAGDEGGAEYVAESFTENRHGSIGGDDEYLPGARVIPVYLSVKKPAEFSDYEELMDFRDDHGGTEGMRKWLVRHGHDGIVVRDSMTDGNVIRDDWVVFEKEQIKSVFNKGKWSKTEASISSGEGQPCGDSFISAEKECRVGGGGVAVETDLARRQEIQNSIADYARPH